MSKRQEFKPYEYQRQATQWALDRKRCGLFLDMSLGKTVCVLTALDELIYDRVEVGRVLVVAPPRVAASTWPAEAAKWAHLDRLRVQPVVGTAKKRRQALATPADVYTISRDLVVWLVTEGLFDFDALIIDELSGFKSPNAKRFRKLRQVARGCERVIGLTGTPSPNGLMDLWAELYLIDKGERLGLTIGSYRDAYFKPGARRGMVVYNWVLKEGAHDRIMARIEDICITMDKEDYLDLPEKLYRDEIVQLGTAAREIYDTVERDQIAELTHGETIVAANAAAVSNKLQQIADGAAYDDDMNAVAIHDAKIEALADMVEASNGAPMLVFYAFRFERSRILAEIPGARALDTVEDLEAWNRGEIPVAVAHPASVGHGLNLQYGGHVAVWYGLTWSLELYQQANDRLHRPGQVHPVAIVHLVASGTVDEAILAALKRKDAGQSALIEYLSAKAREARL